jgi:hypothetical protein
VDTVLIMVVDMLMREARVVAGVARKVLRVAVGQGVALGLPTTVAGIPETSVLKNKEIPQSQQHTSQPEITWLISILCFQ